VGLNDALNRFGGKSCFGVLVKNIIAWHSNLALYVISVMNVKIHAAEALVCSYNAALEEESSPLNLIGKPLFDTFAENWIGLNSNNDVTFD